MPHAVAGLHPFQSARRDLAFLSRRVLVGNPTGEHDGERRDTGMRMDAEKRLACRHDLAVIEEHERLDQLADIGRADEARDRTVPAAAGAKRDTARGGAYGALLRCLEFERLTLGFGNSHWLLHCSVDASEAALWPPWRFLLASRLIRPSTPRLRISSEKALR